MTEWFCETKIKDGKFIFNNEGTEAPAEVGMAQRQLN